MSVADMSLLQWSSKFANIDDKALAKFPFQKADMPSHYSPDRPFTEPIHVRSATTLAYRRASGLPD
jgi:hypothetical protein